MIILLILSVALLKWLWLNFAHILLYMSWIYTLYSLCFNAKEDSPYYIISNRFLIDSVYSLL